MRLFIFILGIIGLFANIITIMAVLKPGSITTPIVLIPVDADFGYVLLTATGALYITAWFMIKEKIRFSKDSTIVFLGVLYFIPLAIVVYAALRVFGHPKAPLLDMFFGNLAEIITPK